MLPGEGRRTGEAGDGGPRASDRATGGPHAEDLGRTDVSADCHGDRRITKHRRLPLPVGTRRVAATTHEGRHTMSTPFDSLEHQLNTLRPARLPAAARRSILHEMQRPVTGRGRAPWLFGHHAGFQVALASALSLALVAGWY